MNCESLSDEAVSSAMEGLRTSKFNFSTQEQQTRRGLKILLSEVFARLWPLKTDIALRALAGKVVFGVETKLELDQLPVNTVALGVRAFHWFEQHRKQGDAMPASKEGLTAELEQCMQIARDEMAERLD